MDDGLEMCVRRRVEIDMGHRIPNHKSKCRHLHGHRYVFEVEVAGPLTGRRGASDEGMIIDFGDIKEILVSRIHEPWDHGFMLYEGDPLREALEALPEQKIVFVPFVPTAENIARHAFTLLAPELARRGLTLAGVTVWETPNSRACVRAAR